MANELEQPDGDQLQTVSVPLRQKTIARQFFLSGIGLHTGKKVKVSFRPAPGNHGIKFRRTDITGKMLIEALAENVASTARGTTIAVNGISVSTAEHVFAAISALGIDNLLIEINAGEVPILDGSALEFIKGIKAAGTISLNEERKLYTIKEDITYKDPEKALSFPEAL